MADLAKIMRVAMLLGWLALVGPVPIAEAEAPEANGIIVYQTDFGLKDGAVSAMRGVAVAVDPRLRLEDLTHEIPAFNIWEGAYRLADTVPYWPSGTVFVSVVDPGVGTGRKSVVLATESGHFVVSPDNPRAVVPGDLDEHHALMADPDVWRHLRSGPGPWSGPAGAPSGWGRRGGTSTTGSRRPRGASAWPPSSWTPPWTPPAPWNRTGR